MNSPANWRLGLVSKILHSSGVIAYPTEGVWGLGCLPAAADAVLRILELKNRSVAQGLLLVAADIEQFETYLEGIDRDYRSELEVNWPGAVTYLVPDNGTAPRWIVGNHPTLGLRVSAHPLVKTLCEVVAPLVSTSANIASRPSALNTFSVMRYFGDAIDYVVPGKLGESAGPSQIRVLETGEVIR